MGSRHDREDRLPDVASAIAEQGMRAFLEDHRARLADVDDATPQGSLSASTQVEDQIRAALLGRLAADLEEVRRRPVRAQEEPSASTDDATRAALLARLFGDLEQVRRKPGRALAALESARTRGDEDVRREAVVVPRPVAAPPVLVPQAPVAPKQPAAAMLAQPRGPAADEHRIRRRAFMAAAVALGSAAVVVLAVLIGAALRDYSSDEVYRESPAVAAVAPPAGLPESGVLVESVVHDDGTQTVTEWVSSDRPISQLTLDTPSGADLDAQPEAVDVRVTAGGRKVSGDDVVGGRPSIYYLYEGSDMIKITYTLKDSVLISPDAEGRALVVASALRVGDAVTGPMRVRVTGGKVLSMACAAGAGSQDPCGEPTDQGWQVLLSGDSRDDRVITQLDLG